MKKWGFWRNLSERHHRIRLLFSTIESSNQRRVSENSRHRRSIRGYMRDFEWADHVECLPQTQMLEYLFDDLIVLDEGDDL